MPTNRIKITEEQFDSGQIPIPSNHIVVEVSYSNEGAKTKSGIIVGFDKDVTYEGENSAHAADLQEVYGIVVKVPEKLYFDRDDPQSMSYETEMELEVGDKVWFGIMESANCHELVVGNQLFKIIPYADIFVAKRMMYARNMVTREPFRIMDKIIVLNGYCLCQTVNRLKISELDVVTESMIDNTKCIVKYVGKPNIQYKEPSYVDHADLREGDTVLLQPRTPILLLERKKYMSSFEGDELFIVVPRRKIVMIINRV